MDTSCQGHIEGVWDTLRLKRSRLFVSCTKIHVVMYLPVLVRRNVQTKFVNPIP